jgi:protein CpxP
MNRIRLLAIGAMLMFAFTTVAQQAQQTTSSGEAQVGSGSASGVDRHMKLLTEKLDLTSDQQAKVKPILQEMHDAMQKFVQDESMSRDERMDNVKASRYKADREVRKILSDEQKKKLDQFEDEMHSEMHGNMNGATSPPAQQK